VSWRHIPGNLFFAQIRPEKKNARARARAFFPENVLGKHYKCFAKKKCGNVCSGKKARARARAFFSVTHLRKKRFPGMWRQDTAQKGLPTSAKNVFFQKRRSGLISGWPIFRDPGPILGVPEEIGPRMCAQKGDPGNSANPF
jgi:hypothetical protein